jgi:hypothetical protein
MAQNELKPPAPVTIRHLSTATSVYAGEVEKVLSLLEEGLIVAPETMIAYLPLLDQLRVLVGALDIGSLPAVQTACRALLGESD